MGRSRLLDLGQPFSFLALLDLLFHGFGHLVEHLLVQLQDVDLVAGLLDPAIELLYLQFECLDTDGIFERQLCLVKFVGLVLLAGEPVQFMIEFFFLLDHSFQGVLGLEELSADLVVLPLELGELMCLFLDRGILFIHFIKMNQFFCMPNGLGLFLAVHEVVDHFILLIGDFLELLTGLLLVVGSVHFLLFLLQLS